MKLTLKKIVLILLCTTAMMRADVSIDIQAGNLKADPTGTAGLQTGSLLLLVAAGANGTFTDALTAGHYVAGDDVILVAFASNNNLGGNSATSKALTGVNVTGLIGQKLELRWFPQIQYTDYLISTTPAIGNYFGVFAGATAGNPDGGDPWLVPADLSSNYTLNMQTSSLSGSQPNSAGFASLTVTDVPEPSTFALLGLGMGFAGWMARRKKA